MNSTENQPPNILDAKTTGSSPPADRLLRTRGYAGKFSAFVIAALVLLATRDLKNQQSSHILSLFGLRSIIWAWCWLIFGAVLTFAIAGLVGLGSYSFLAVKRHKDPDPIDPIEAGVFDVSFWSGLSSYMAVFCSWRFCSQVVPGGCDRQ